MNSWFWRGERIVDIWTWMRERGDSVVIFRRERTVPSLSGHIEHEREMDWMPSSFYDHMTINDGSRYEELVRFPVAPL